MGFLRRRNDGESRVPEMGRSCVSPFLTRSYANPWGAAQPVRGARTCGDSVFRGVVGLLCAHVLRRRLVRCTYLYNSRGDRRGRWSGRALGGVAVSYELGGASRCTLRAVLHPAGADGLWGIPVPRVPLRPPCGGLRSTRGYELEPLRGQEGTADSVTDPARPSLLPGETFSRSRNRYPAGGRSMMSRPS